MLKRARLSVLVVMVALCVTVPGIAGNVLIWKYSGAAKMHDPEKLAIGEDPESSWVGPEYALQKALTENKQNCDVVEQLPESLSDYEIVFITAGFAFLEAG